MLKHPDFTKLIYINTDTSGISVGIVLYQLSEDNDQQMLAFASWTLMRFGRNYSVTEKELLGIVFACKVSYLSAG